MKRRAYDVAENIRAFFQSSAVEVLSFTLDMARRFAEIRTTQRVSPPDAIHLACAAQAGADLFLTNDHRLRNLVVPGIHIIAGMDSTLL
jgi:predicted nucleic acid-binding protein